MDNKNVTLYGMENDMALLQFLRSKNTERFTKLDAFCYLIGKMSEQAKAHKGDSATDVSPLCHGSFTGSISELASDWHWHRATVRSFLDGLESLGVITRKLDGRDYTFTLRTHATQSKSLCNANGIGTRNDFFFTIFFTCFSSALLNVASCAMMVNGNNKELIIINNFFIL